jgi:hypothetical protein
MVVNVHHKRNSLNSKQLGDNVLETPDLVIIVLLVANVKYLVSFDLELLHHAGALGLTSLWRDSSNINCSRNGPIIRIFQHQPQLSMAYHRAFTTQLQNFHSYLLHHQKNGNMWTSNGMERTTTFLLPLFPVHFLMYLAHSSTVESTLLRLPLTPQVLVAPRQALMQLEPSNRLREIRKNIKTLSCNHWV